jgi:hypothetical protein
VSVKWGKNKFEIEIDPNSPALALKKKLEELSKVPSQNQKGF